MGPGRPFRPSLPGEPADPGGPCQEEKNTLLVSI